MRLTGFGGGAPSARLTEIRRQLRMFKFGQAELALLKRDIENLLAPRD